MSDSSDRSFSDYSENNSGSGGDEDVPDNVEDEWTDFEEDSDPDEAVEEVHKKEIDLLSKITLCATHKSGFMVPHSCKMCAAALGLIKDTDVVKSWFSTTSHLAPHWCPDTVVDAILAEVEKQFMKLYNSYTVHQPIIAAH